MPGKVVTETGQTVFTGEDIRLGQQAILTRGLMEYGSVYGHGVYLGPDFTADYLHRQALEMAKVYFYRHDGKQSNTVAPPHIKGAARLKTKG